MGDQWIPHFSGQDGYGFTCNNFAKVDFEFLCGIDILHGLVVLLPLLEGVNNFDEVGPSLGCFCC
jgi:hypothetical protein